MPQERKRVLVFGATGEIGSRVVRGCLEAGHDVCAVSRGQNTRHAVDIRAARHVTGDKGDEAFVSALLSSEAFDTVIDTVPSPEHIALAHKHLHGRIEHYLLCSSTGVYPPLQYLPADEDHPWREKTAVNFDWVCPRDAYALDLWEQHAFPVTILRPTNIIGAGRIPIDLWGGRSIHYFELMRQGETVEIPGSGNILVQPGCNDDLAAGFVNAVVRGEEICGETFILSCRRAITLDRYFDVAKDVLDSRSAAEHASLEQIVRKRPDEAEDMWLRFLMEHMCFDITKAQTMLGYAPRYSAEEGIELALRWCVDEGLL